MATRFFFIGKNAESHLEEEKEPQSTYNGKNHLIAYGFEWPEGAKAYANLKCVWFHEKKQPKTIRWFQKLGGNSPKFIENHHLRMVWSGQKVQKHTQT